jgi:type IV pilus assembly protein PilX
MKKRVFPTQGVLGTSHERGASLIMVLVILTIVSLLGIAGIQISMMSERGARNDRDLQIAWEAAEAALLDAENDIFGPATSSRRSTFTPVTDMQAFVDGCGTDGNSRGLCAPAIRGRPVWLTAVFDFSNSSSHAPSTAYGTFTGRIFAAGSIGIQPVQPPRYVIEPIRDPADRDLGSPSPMFIYRVTAMGFGPRKDIQAVVQMIYRN